MHRREIRAKLKQYRLNVGQRITKAMEDKKISNAELALLCGVQTRHIRFIKRGARGYVHGNLIRLIAQALEVSAGDLEGSPPEFKE